ISPRGEVLIAPDGSNVAAGRPRRIRGFARACDLLDRAAAGRRGRVAVLGSVTAVHRGGAGDGRAGGRPRPMPRGTTSAPPPRRRSRAGSRVTAVVSDVLGTVVERPMHPYEMASLIRARGEDADLDVEWGSLYTVVRNLVTHGFIEVAGSGREGARPERTVYRITDAGRAELRDWNHELVATAVPEHPRFKAGLSMLAVLPPEAAASALGSRIAQLERAVAATRAALEGSGGVPRLFLVETEYEPAVREAELAWVRGLLDELHRVRQKPDVARAQAPPQPVVGDAGAVVGHGEPRPVARPSLCPRRRARRRWPAARGRSASAAARPAPRPRVPLRRGRPAGPSACGA